MSSCWAVGSRLKFSAVNEPPKIALQNQAEGMQCKVIVTDNVALVESENKIACHGEGMGKEGTVVGTYAFFRGTLLGFCTQSRIIYFELKGFKIADDLRANLHTYPHAHGNPYPYAY